MKFSSYGIFIFLSFFFSVSSQGKTFNVACPGKKIPLSYAENFLITRGDGFDLIEVKSKTNTQKVLLSYGKTPDCRQGLTLKLPLSRLTSNSTTHVGFLLALQSEGLLKGITEGKFLYDDSLRERYENGDIRELGYPVSEEILLSLHTDLHFSSLYNGGVNSSVTDLKRYSIPVLLVLEYEERHPLGRAEWVKLFSLLVGKWEEGLAIFEKEKKAYEEIRKNSTQGVPVLLGKLQGPQWYAPSSQSFLSQLVQDAGGKAIITSPKKSEQRMVLSFEEVLKAIPQSIFYWFPETGWKNFGEMKAEDYRYELLLKKDPLIYNYNKKMASKGGNDYWERGVVTPSKILKDIRGILGDDSRKVTQNLEYYERIQ